MEPKDSEFVFSTPRANESKNKGKEEELTPNSDSNKRKMSSFPNGSSSNESSQGLADFSIGRSKKKSFSCKYCPRTFLCSQALGGHQNAHKDERALAKAEKKKSHGCFGYGADGVYPHGSMGYCPYHQNAMIPRFLAPNLAPSGLSIFGWNGPRFNPLPPNAFFPQENTAIVADYAIDKDPNFAPPNFNPQDGISFFGWNGPRFNLPSPNSISPEKNMEICDEYAIKGEPNGEEKGEEPLDLTLKL